MGFFILDCSFKAFDLKISSPHAGVTEKFQDNLSDEIGLLQPSLSRVGNQQDNTVFQT